MDSLFCGCCSCGAFSDVVAKLRELEDRIGVFESEVEFMREKNNKQPHERGW